MTEYVGLTIVYSVLVTMHLRQLLPNQWPRVRLHLHRCCASSGGAVRPTCSCGWVRHSDTAVTYAPPALVVDFVAPAPACDHNDSPCTVVFTFGHGSDCI